MPFTEIELRHLEDTVGKMGKRRSPPHLRDELRIVYEVERLDVVVHEERPDWHDSKRWSRMESLNSNTVEKMVNGNSMAFKKSMGCVLSSPRWE